MGSSAAFSLTHLASSLTSTPRLSIGGLNSTKSLTLAGPVTHGLKRRKNGWQWEVVVAIHLCFAPRLEQQLGFGWLARAGLTCLGLLVFRGDDANKSCIFISSGCDVCAVTCSAIPLRPMKSSVKSSALRLISMNPVRML